MSVGCNSSDEEVTQKVGAEVLMQPCAYSGSYITKGWQGTATTHFRHLNE